MGSCLCPVLDEVLGLLQMLIKVNCNKTGQPRVSAMLFWSWCCEHAKECLSSESRLLSEYVCIVLPESHLKTMKMITMTMVRLTKSVMSMCLLSVLLGCYEVVGFDVSVSG